MNIKIKICGICEQNNMADVADLKPDMMGFIFYPLSPRNMSDTMPTEIFTELPSDIRKVGVFVNEDLYTIQNTVLKYSLDIVQLHGNESPEMCWQLKETGIRIIKAFNINSPGDFGKCAVYVPFTSYFLFDTATEKHGGSGEKFDWGILGGYKLDHPFFLSGGIAPGDQYHLFRINNPAFHGIDLNSRFEIKPGIKNITLLKDFINDIRNKNILL